MADTYKTTSSRSDAYSVNQFEWTTTMGDCICTVRKPVQITRNAGMDFVDRVFVFAIFIGPVLIFVFAPIYASLSHTFICDALAPAQRGGVFKASNEFESSDVQRRRRWAGQPRGLNTARKQKITRRDNRWADKQYKKRALGNFYKSSPTGGSSQAKGIVLEKVGVEAKQPNSAIRKCVRVQCSDCDSDPLNRLGSAYQKRKEGLCWLSVFVPNDGCLNFVDENDEVLIIQLDKWDQYRNSSTSKGRVIEKAKDSPAHGHLFG
ncbi:hypothetical protein A4X09_0g46 [Tilletia walkeri]|uniref:Uncharacterized protein n=1 Tax=Tilletia walkeri TaxID=117179 RepID=A0A8X7T8V3_9BASI|nr:hypothetical protein A4X09_0g46 [Tilletia walkeri]